MKEDSIGLVSTEEKVIPCEPAFYTKRAARNFRENQ